MSQPFHWKEHNIHVLSFDSIKHVFTYAIHVLFDIRTWQDDHSVSERNSVFHKFNSDMDLVSDVWFTWCFNPPLLPQKKLACLNVYLYITWWHKLSTPLETCFIINATLGTAMSLWMSWFWTRNQENTFCHKNSRVSFLVTMLSGETTSRTTSSDLANLKNNLGYGQLALVFSCRSTSLWKNSASFSYRKL